ncbi:MAG: hypothetical protein P1U39_05460 [Legionellaceae bacterium]|nr:hypothetical protein [Legionellaceae bacterium]
MIEQYIPLYDLLTQEEQTEFERTEDYKNLLKCIKQCKNKHQPFNPYGTFTSRNLKKPEVIDLIQNYIIIKAQTSPAFKRLQVRMITKFFPGLEFSDAEMRYLLSQDYSAALLVSGPETWVASFCADDTPQAKTIQDEVETLYDYLFGFLFKKKRDLRELLDMTHALALKPPANLMQGLQDMIHEEWKNPASYQERILTSLEEHLGFVYKNPLKTAKKYIDKVANAYMLYRFLGFTSEHMVLGFGLEAVPIPSVDLLNYHILHRDRQSIHDFLGVLYTLSIPFRFFFHEYADIARFEKNPLIICLRAFLPFCVMGVILSCAYTILLPLAAHVFLEYMLFIPTLYLSIATAGAYIRYKNSTYTAMLEWWYGSLYMAPQFHANQRIETAFLHHGELSTRVARYYANSLEACDLIEQNYAKRESTLRESEISDREANKKFKYSLFCEWFALHDRQDLGTDRIPAIVLERLSSDKKRLQHKLKEYSDDWCILFEKKQYFFDKPILRERFNGLKQSLFDLEELESDIKEYLEHVDRTEAHRELQLDMC